MADPQSLNKVSAESSWHTVAGRQARMERFHQTRSRHKHHDATRYVDAEPTSSASGSVAGCASNGHSPPSQQQGLRAQDLASSLTELANFVAQSQRENLPAGVPVPAEVRFRY
eukprot:g20884.t1